MGVDSPTPSTAITTPHDSIPTPRLVMRVSGRSRDRAPAAAGERVAAAVIEA
ncbi:hypothetical protein Dac01nite_10300 [Demequina activiva]|uniref:Uncharacterized protein n=1 Tax=Demequina activiva TaxID=1582364 RepID=A0A919Q4D8_9MICO|nr:hypothetical protein Dac01nite_10300 [Demequina activiva]